MEGENLEQFYYEIEKDLFHEPINDLEGFLDCARYNEDGDSQLLVEYLEEFPHHIDAKDEQGRTAVHMAAANGHLGLLEALYQFRPTVNLANHEGNTALHFAALNNKVNAAIWLLERGWLPSVKNNSGKTPLQEIYDKEFNEMETVLIKFDASLDDYVPPSGAAVDVEGEEDEESAPTAEGEDATPEVKKKAAPPAKGATSSPKNNTTSNNAQVKKEKKEKTDKVEAVLGSTDVDGIE
ncbi:e3 ubiquitin-protein ligase MIB2 [Angomonas deanei]|uniref:Ankyrin repeats (3 copies)/Ankyrin repeats (Many copies)/Ankyrin repeat, putative n=1 Tax=Angomonas deanei TaxID=59799 RepID=S9U684_9TRYP|nr:e3 ubiquitin-protein ligase MIB2 [Angomonas deanei]EPY38006.1 e3 ubiquitin-protein ligase MIB2 [Angomonas deanei]CAD2218999.1 Ankyrin repeats (3 copies)/Ankyrin repeats (many copies)/Ankyrin repeat, putative [Angomonas deanei]|eukprot:EPY24453.1 e3 ubiquitin-protein ligase MIB2 [Angomonas deanei]